MFQDSRCLTETPRFLDEIPRFPIDRNSKISEIPKPKSDSESGSIFPLMFQICFGLYLGGEILAQRPHVGGGIFHTEFIQICTMFGVDFDKKQHIHQIL